MFETEGFGYNLTPVGSSCPSTVASVFSPKKLLEEAFVTLIV